MNTWRKHAIGLAGLSAATAVMLGTALTRDSAIAGVPGAMPPPIPVPLEKATPLSIPKPKASLMPTPFPSGTKLKGWVVEIPGNHPICTPAYADGKLYVGGGYGSYEFYAFDAATGKLAWKYHTGDDGPTAAVVEDGCVAFNTESCTVYVLDAATGKELWKEWLGDPLMSQPAIAKGRLFMAYPSGQRGKGQAGHSLLCADLRTGKHYWNKPISGDIISSPVIEYDRVYVACMDGTSYCFSTIDGTQVWKKEGQATSAPVVHDGKLIISERAGAGDNLREGIRRVHAQSGAFADKGVICDARAPYIQGATNGTIGPQSGDASRIAAVNSGGGGGAAKSKAQWYAKMDGGVGFGGGAPQASGLDRAVSNLGISTVSGAWGYQGARAAYSKGLATNTQLTYVNCVDANTGAVKWRAEAQAKFVTGQSQVFSTPSMGAQRMYLCSGDGHVVCMDQKTGQVQYMYSTSQPISFQPALANGSLYIGTANGQLLCLSVDDPDANGWFAWGGNAQHNKTD